MAIFAVGAHQSPENRTRMQTDATPFNVRGAGSIRPGVPRSDLLQIDLVVIRRRFGRGRCQIVAAAVGIMFITERREFDQQIIEIPLTEDDELPQAFVLDHFDDVFAACI